MDVMKIVIVDDEQHNRKLLEKSLQGNYQTLSYGSGEECLADIDKQEPDVFLLDVRMPGGMDGFELCQTLRQQARFEDIPILFLSAMDSLEQKLKGYEVGADDYITKPLELTELERKLEKISVRISRAKQRRVESKSAYEVAMTAMTNSGEIGEVLRFYEGLGEVKSYQALADYTVETLQNFGLNTIIQLRLSNDCISASTSGSYNELEEKLMQQAESLDRIYSFGNRCLFTFKQASLLVRKMPQDPDAAGRIRDHFASILNGVEARLNSLHAEQALRKQNEGLIVKALDITHSALEDILSKFKSHELEVSSIIDSMRQEMDVAFSYLDLSEEQEEHLASIFSSNKSQIDELFIDGQKIDTQFMSVVQTLKTLLERS